MILFRGIINQNIILHTDLEDSMFQKIEVTGKIN